MSWSHGDNLVTADGYAHATATPILEIIEHNVRRESALLARVKTVVPETCSIAGVARSHGRQLIVVLISALLATGCTDADEMSLPASLSPASPPTNSSPPLDSTYRAFVALENAGEVAVVTGPVLQVTARIAVPAGPHNLAASADGQYVAVTSPSQDTVTIVRAADASVVAQQQVSGYPHDVAFTPDGGRLWVTAERGRSLVALSVPDGRQIEVVPLDAGPHDLAISPDGQELWVTIDGSSAVEVRSPLDGALRSQPNLGGAPHDVAFSPDGAEVWFSNWSSPLLTVVSAPSREVMATLDAGTEPHHFAFAAGQVIASDHAGDAVLRIDQATRQIIERMPTGPAPHHVGVVGDTVLVAVNGTGQLATVDLSGAVTSLDVGAGPHDVVVLPG
jgi:DNA-binding beta-propeller fold protein YncE